MQLRMQLRNSRWSNHPCLLVRWQYGWSKTTQLHDSAAIPSLLAFIFEVEVHLVEPMQFMGEFDDLAILVVEAVFEFLVLMVIFIE